jgi:hypothetical protein
MFLGCGIGQGAVISGQRIDMEKRTADGFILSGLAAYYGYEG